MQSSEPPLRLPVANRPSGWPPERHNAGALLPSASPLFPPVSRAPTDATTARRRLHLFMVMRLGVATLLLGATLIIALDGERGFNSFTPRFLASLIAVMYASSLVFAVWLLRSVHRDRIAMTQIGLDLFVTTGLVYVTGGPGSGFTFLYGVGVLMAAMVVGPVSARLTGTCAILLYGALGVSLATGTLQPPPDQLREAYLVTVGELARAGLLNVLGLLFVTLLAGDLSARLLTAGGQLRIAEANAATLARLNDDIVRSLSSGLVSTDLDGRIRTVNPTAIEMLGAEPAVLLGQPISNLIDIQPNDVHVNVARAESIARRADGTHFLVGYSVNSLLNIDGTSIGSLVLFQDLSEIARLRDIAARQERLAVLGRLSAGLAHEIRNPLGSISGSVQLVRESADLTDEERNLLGIILSEVERLDDLVTTMLQVGRPREPQRNMHDLREAVDTVVDMVQRGPAATAGIRIARSLPPRPVMAWIDGDQVRQVLWNLVKNALQASPSGTVVRVTATSRADGTAVLEVSDEGEGIDPTQREKVYSMFYSERTHGAGIGLALVRQIVDAHGGTIEIISEQDQGATFIVTFPPKERAPIIRHSNWPE